MAGVLFVIYIPCDDSSDDTPGTEGKSEGKRESKRPGASQADDEKDAEEDSEENQENAVNELSPLVGSDSGIHVAPEVTFQVLLAILYHNIIGILFFEIAVLECISSYTTEFYISLSIIFNNDK